MGHAEFTLRNQPTQKPLSLDELWMPFTPNRDFKADPKIVVRAEGMYYWNDRGEQDHRRVVGAVLRRRRPWPQGNRRRRASAAARARFRRAVPARASEELRAGVARRRAHARATSTAIFFVNSGSEAVDTAMKVALAYHQARGQAGRTMFVSRERAYHGVNFGGVALSGIVNNRRKFGPGIAGVVAHAAHAREGELVHARRGRARRRPRRRPDALRQPVRRGEHRRVLRRADRRLHRLPRAAEGLPCAAARRSATRTASCSCSTR